MPRGAPPPASAPGTGQRKVDGTYVCGGPNCDGPLGFIYEGIRDTIGHRPEVVHKPPPRPRRTTQRERNIARRREMFAPRPDPRVVAARQLGVSTYCCICGEVGLCWVTGVDCRQLPVLQRSKGQC